MLGPLSAPFWSSGLPVFRWSSVASALNHALSDPELCARYSLPRL